MNKRTIDEMIAHFNQEVSNMDIAREYKMALLGMITAIGFESKKQKVKPGKWEQHIFDGIMGQRPTAWVCSNCNCLSVYKTDYCPNCGAKMIGDEDEQKN